MAESTTPRLALPRWSADTDSPNRTEFDTAFGNLEDRAVGFLTGTLAARPTAAAANARFVYDVSGDATATNNGRLFWSTGAAWIEIVAPTAAGAAGQVPTRQADGSILWSNATSVVFLSASEMIATFGTPTLSGIGSVGDKTSLGWLLDAASPENLTGQKIIPDGWTTANVVLWWTNAGAGAGTVRWTAMRDGAISNGDTLMAGAGVILESAAPTQNVAKLDLIASAVTVSPGELFGVRVQRDASHANDNLANDAVLLGVSLVKVS